MLVGAEDKTNHILLLAGEALGTRSGGKIFLEFLLGSQRNLHGMEHGANPP